VILGYYSWLQLTRSQEFACIRSAYGCEAERVPSPWNGQGQYARDAINHYLHLYHPVPAVASVANFQRLRIRGKRVAVVYGRYTGSQVTFDTRILAHRCVTALWSRAHATTRGVSRVALTLREAVVR